MATASILAFALSGCGFAFQAGPTTSSAASRSPLATAATPSPTAMPSPTPTVSPTPTPSGSPGATGKFHVFNASIVAPDGSTFIGKGINVADWAAVGPGGSGNGTDNGTVILQLFPGLNMVRMNAQSTSPNLAMDLAAGNYNDDPAALSTFVANLTAAKVVVVIEDHVVDNAVPAGSAYDNELQWYKDMAAYYKENPYVWFGTMNEPWGNPTATVLRQELDIYNAIRGAGNEAPILMEISVPPDAWTTNWNNQGSYFASMVDVAWDAHIYDLGGDEQAATLIGAAQIGTNIKSADGIMPVIVGEYGSSISGTGPDQFGTHTVISVQGANASGTCAWTWLAGQGDRLQSNNVLTDFGREVLAFFTSGVPPATWTDADGS